MKLGIRELCVFALLLGFLAGSYMLGFRRLQQQRAFYQRDIAAKHAMLASLVASSASVSELEAQLTELRNSVSLFERKLPKQKEVDQILSDVWNLGERHSLRAQSVRPLRVDRAGACSEQPIELSFEGPYTGFAGFLRELESSERIVRITDIELKRVTDPNKPMQTRLTLNIYFEPESTVTAAAQ
jgi:Tfp pilus assembly protein PilO